MGLANRWARNVEIATATSPLLPAVPTKEQEQSNNLATLLQIELDMMVLRPLADKLSL